MSRVAFVSDFDGTLSKRDFYHIVIDKYLGEEGRKFYTDWKKNKKINVEFLNTIFGRLSLTEEELRRDILDIPLDSSGLDFIRQCRERGWDFYILSAGTSYYIKILLEHYNLKDISVTSMEGRFSNGGILITPDKTSPYYSDIFGIDKGKFVKELKEKYDQVFFAGDSEPDLLAALEATVAFGKDELAEMLKKREANFVEITDFRDVTRFFEEKRWF